MAPGGSTAPGRAQTTLLLTHTIVVQAVTFMLRPASAYRALELDVPGAWLGVLGASFAVVPLVLAVPSGHAVDRFGERRVALAGSALLVAAGLGFVLLAGSVAGLVVASMLLGTAHLCAVVAQQALVANRTPAHRYDAAFGYYTFAASLGQALGPGLIVVFGGDRSIPDTRAIFLGATVLAVPLLIAAALLRPSGHHQQRTAGPAAGGMRELLRQPGLVRALTVSCVVLAAVDITLVYLPALGAERGIAAGSIGVLLGVRAVASMASRLLLGKLVAMIGRRALLIGTVALSAVGLGLLLPPLPFWVMAVVVTVAGLGLGAGQPLTMSFLAEVAPPGLRGRAMSLRLTGNRLGQVLIPSAAGVLAAGAGAAGVLACTATGLAGAAVAATGLHRTNPHPD
ncbi:Predicted arabinose efflux permease, MFS family [Micromonospora viridifaciens]|uniref:Predicted arabinose efflux permease, MFS family n=1 Tax=Micromonospora viridifaciens TaxID=1881 RepID=A0A1C4UWM1_MICVI|nr:MFS transporter [Micromonospora viridifaciens]SCE76070.1 Predicted arabinose efflux permease, MFS family [Micromonospora viridifaciens]